MSEQEKLANRIKTLLLGKGHVLLYFVLPFRSSDDDTDAHH